MSQCGMVQGACTNLMLYHPSYPVRNESIVFHRVYELSFFCNILSHGSWDKWCLDTFQIRTPWIWEEFLHLVRSTNLQHLQNNCSPPSMAVILSSNLSILILLSSSSSGNPFILWVVLFLWDYLFTRTCKTFGWAFIWKLV